MHFLKGKKEVGANTSLDMGIVVTGKEILVNIVFVFVLALINKIYFNQFIVFNNVYLIIICYINFRN